jgi:hypothetical protein
MPKLNIFRRFSTRAKAGAAAILAAALFASSPYTNEARAADLSATVSDAALVFSDLQIVQNQTVQICAHNYSKTNVDVIFVFDTQLELLQSPVNTIGTSFGNNSACTDIGSGETSGIWSAAIVLKSPVTCSQSTEYPGKCRVVGSLEVRGGISPDSPVRHLEPTLLPALPPKPQIIVPLPQ